MASKQVVLDKAHIQISECVSQYAGGVLTVAEFCAAIAAIRAGLPNLHGLVDPNTGLGAV